MQIVKYFFKEIQFVAFKNSKTTLSKNLHLGGAGKNTKGN